MWFTLCLMQLFLLFSSPLGVSVYVESMLLAHGTLCASSKLHFTLIQHSFKSPMTFFDTTPIGRIINRFSKDIDVIDTIIPKLINWWSKCTIEVFSTIFVISFSTPVFLVVVVPLGIVYYVIQVHMISTRFFLSFSMPCG